MGFASLLLGVSLTCSPAILVGSFLGVRPLPAVVTIIPVVLIGCRVLAVLP